ncbi:hypothetical protein KPP03845_102753 [Streptomyces xanthophaeus]|nr:hypothetical protein KPP03845_102753 [Streptomyces xanthophaeus]
MAPRAGARDGSPARGAAASPADVRPGRCRLSGGEPPRLALSALAAGVLPRPGRRVHGRPTSAAGYRASVPVGLGPSGAASLAGHGRVCCRPAGGRAAASLTGRQPARPPGTGARPRWGRPVRCRALAGHGRVCCRPAGGRAAVSVTGRGRVAAEPPRRGRLAGGSRPRARPRRGYRAGAGYRHPVLPAEGRFCFVPAALPLLSPAGSPPGRRVPEPGPVGVGPSGAAPWRGMAASARRPAGGRAAVSVTGRGRVAAEPPRRGRLAG